MRGPMPWLEPRRYTYLTEMLLTPRREFRLVKRNQSQALINEHVLTKATAKVLEATAQPRGAHM